MSTNWIRKSGVSLGILATVALVSGTARAAYVDITVNDGSPSSNYGSDPRAGIGESGEVEAGCIANASWDLRAIAFDVNTNSLMIVSGFNPLALNDGIAMGDIFLDVNNSFISPNRPSGSNGFLTYLNSAVGFEYAIDLIDPQTGNLSYNIVALSGASTLLSGKYAQNALSDPAVLIASGADQILASGAFTVVQKTDAQILSETGINIGTNGGTNYVMKFDLSAVSLQNGANFRLTETCGNDLLAGKLAASSLTAVPETSSWVMGILAVGAVVLLVRRNKAAGAAA